MKWLEGAAGVKRRMNNHLRLTDVPSELDHGISALQLRHAREVLRTLGGPFSKRDGSIQFDGGIRP